MPHPIFLRLPVASTNDQLYSSSFAAPSCCIDCLSIDYIMWHPHLLCYKPCNQFLNFWCLQLSWLSTLMYIGLDWHMVSMILTIFNFWYPHKVARNPSILTSLLLKVPNEQQGTSLMLNIIKHEKKVSASCLQESWEQHHTQPSCTKQSIVPLFQVLKH
jgi:hypothetical protein